MSKPSNASAAARTAFMPGVDMREQDDHNAPSFHGPLLRRATTHEHPPSTHLVRVDAPSRALCGRLVPRQDHDHGKVCEACRVEASRIRGIVQ